VAVSHFSITCDSPDCFALIERASGNDRDLLATFAEGTRSFLTTEGCTEDYKGRDLCPECSPQRPTEA
jgi:hypothetical protein